MSQQAATNFVFKFIAGKYEGGAFALPSHGEVLIGRSIEVPICLVEDMVSRRHARLMITAQGLSIQDLGSTNGTFVNGERVEQSALTAGDRILVGTSIMRLEAAETAQSALVSGAPVPTAMELAGELTQPSGAPAALEAIAAAVTGPNQVPSAPSRAAAAEPAASADASLSGSLADMKLFEVLELLARSARTGLLTLTLPRAVVHLGFAAGQWHSAQATGAWESIAPSKLLVRLLQHPSTGEFSFAAGEAPPMQTAIGTRTTEAWLLEAARQSDEMQRKLLAMGAQPDTRISMVPQKGRKLSTLPPARLDVLQLALEQQTIGATLDAHDGADDEVLDHLAALIGEGYLTLAA